MLRFVFVFSALITVLSLSGCVAIALEEADVWGVKRANVPDYAYAAADVLLDEAVRAKRVTVKTPIGFERLKPLQGLDPRGRLAMLLPEHMGTRVAERGYMALGRERTIKPMYLMTGTYSMDHPYIVVSLKLVEAQTQASVSSTSFKMPLTRNIRNLVSLPPIGVSFTDEEIVRAQERHRNGETLKPVPANRPINRNIEIEGEAVVIPPLPPGEMTPSEQLPVRVVP